MKTTLTRQSAARQQRPKLRLVPRGQAMVEYTLVAHFILMGGALALLPLVVKLFEALNQFYDSVYFVLQTGAL